jgi:predicted SAM-dependent methyltransferase
MNEQSKAAIRRKLDPRYENRWFVGRGLDVGCGPDPLRVEDWSKVTEVVPYDVMYGNKDGRFLTEIKGEEFDFIHSSHCLEHLLNPRSTLVNWTRVLKPGGFIICTVPEEFLYELGHWPSHFNPDHKCSFSMRAMPIISTSVNVLHLLWKAMIDVELVSLLTDGWDPADIGQDQTMGRAECAIEFVARKPDQTRPW